MQSNYICEPVIQSCVGCDMVCGQMCGGGGLWACVRCVQNGKRAQQRALPCEGGLVRWAVGGWCLKWVPKGCDISEKRAPSGGCLVSHFFDRHSIPILTGLCPCCFFGQRVVLSGCGAGQKTNQKNKHTCFMGVSCETMLLEKRHETVDKQSARCGLLAQRNK